MNGFWEFLSANTNSVQSDLPSERYKEGVAGVDFLESTDTHCMDPISRARFLYVKNLCLNDPVEFEVPEVLSSSEQGLMFLSFNSVEKALTFLDTGLRCDIVGVNARTRTGTLVCVPVVQTQGTRSQDSVEYRAHGYSYGGLKVQPLDVQELRYMFARMMDIYRNEDNDTLKKFKLNAYLRRVEMEENALNDALKRAFFLLDAVVNNAVDGLDSFRENTLEIKESMFEMPIIFKFDMMIHLGLSLKKNFFYSEAYQVLASYPMYLERIDCLIALRKSQEAAGEIAAHISRIGAAKDRHDRMVLCDLYIKLGHLYQDARYYDMAADVFSSAKPYHVKGLFYFNRKEYRPAAEAFEQALALTPHSEQIRFSYACTLVELERISEALEVFQVLKAEDPMNSQIAKNLSYCYYKKKDVENSLKALRSVAMSDPSSMNQFFLISIKNKKMDNVKWALSKMSCIDYIRGGVSHLISNNLLPMEELRQLVESNQYVDSETLDSIFGT